jgi:hypothetical protein
MSSGQPNENEHDEEVQRMLALKRHEQPPPAFFRGFSEQIRDRIQTAGPTPTPTWRQWLSTEFYGVPIYACAAGVLVVGLLGAGLVSSLRLGPAQRGPDRGNAELVDGQSSPTLVPPQSRMPVAAAPKDPNGALQPTQARLAPDSPSK